jgi:AraC-like DNA-binding protein
METVIELEDVYVEDIVKGMANTMNAPYKEQGNTTSFSIPKDIGEGLIEATQFASGLGFISAKYKFQKETIFEIEKDKINPLKFVFNLGEEFYHKFENDKEYRKLEKYTSAIISSSPDNMHSFMVPKEKDIHIFSIELNRNLFEHKINDFNFELDDELITLLRDVESKKPFFYNCYFGAKELELIQKIIKVDKQGFIGSLYKEGIVYNLLSLSLENYLGKKCSDGRSKMSKEDIDTVVNASSFIEENMNDLPTIEEIAAKHLVSESKIQKLFKDYYKCSVHDFLSNKRLELAKNLLEGTDKTIAEIAEDLGIRSKSYFSKIFKDRYGVTPSNYRGSRLARIRFY